MSRVALTDRTIKALKADKHPVEKYDARVPGLGIRVMPAGSKTWVFSYARPRDKKRGRYSFGHFAGETGGRGYTLSDARKEANKLRDMVAEGRDP